MSGMLGLGRPLNGLRIGGAAQRFGVAAVRRTGRGAYVERDGARKAMRLESRPQPVDDTKGALKVRIEKGEPEPSTFGFGEEIGFAYLAAYEARDLADGDSGCGIPAAYPRRRRPDADESEEILRAHGAFELVAQNEVERLRRQDAVVFIEEEIASHQEALPRSASLIL
jgi:hypothetical protein